MTPNTDAPFSLLGPQPLPDNVLGILRFCSHIKEKATNHSAVLIPYGGTHTSTPIIFHSAFPFSLFFAGSFPWSYSLSSLTWSCPCLLAQERFQKASTVTRHFLYFYSPDPFQASSLTPVCHVFSIYPSSIMSTPLSVGDGHWCWGWWESRGHRETKKPNIQQMAGALLNLPMSLSLAQHKRPDLWGPPLHHLTPTVTPSVEALAPPLLLRYDCTLRAWQ